jgi:hypothetical protein
MLGVVGALWALESTLRAFNRNRALVSEGAEAVAAHLHLARIVAVVLAYHALPAVYAWRWWPRHAKSKGGRALLRFSGAEQFEVVPAVAAAAAAVAGRGSHSSTSALNQKLFVTRTAITQHS